MKIRCRPSKLLPSLALVLGCLTMASPAAAAGRLGINVNHVFNDNWYDQPFADAQLSAASRDGVTLGREDAFWPAVEPNPPVNGVHSYVWRATDFVASNLAKYAIQWLPVLDYSATWDATGLDYHSAPRSNADYAAFAQAFAQRYGPGGTFWRMNPTLPYLPISTFEIWNEEDSSYFWNNGPSPVQYAGLYRAAQSAIKQVNPNATVVIGGLVPNWVYIQKLFGAFWQVGVHPDAIAFHPYASSPPGAYSLVRLFKENLDWIAGVLAWPFVHTLPIYITEYGWTTSGISQFLAPDPLRAQYLPGVADTLARSDCGIAVVTPYTWTTPMQNTSSSDEWWGIHRWSGGDTQTATAYSQLLQLYNSGRQPAGTTRVCY